MTVLVLSDIHGNLEAFEAILAAAGMVDEIWFLGDLVGYGPNPNECVARLAELRPAVWLAGNHDFTLNNPQQLERFNSEARLALEWTDDVLTDANRELLRGRPAREDWPERDVTLVHASPRSPIWEYITNATIALENLTAFDTPLLFFGHTHVPVIYEEHVDGVLRAPLGSQALPLPSPDLRWLVNPGSVGQPRDGDPRASALLLDFETHTLRLLRTPYDVAAVQHKILAAGLPEKAASRLDYGW